jgi:hypothetical protein
MFVGGEFGRNAAETRVYSRLTRRARQRQPFYPSNDTIQQRTTRCSANALSPRPRLAVPNPGVVTDIALLVSIITWSVVSDTGSPTIEPTFPMNLTGWESSAVSGPTNVSPPTNAGGVPSHTSEALEATHPMTRAIPFSPTIPSRTPKASWTSRGSHMCRESPSHYVSQG